MTTRIVRIMHSAAVCLIGVALMIVTGNPACSETPEEWVALGTRVHGGFGTFIPVGIRIGEDALQRLGAVRRGVTVDYSSGPDAPCPCVADGIAIATEASVGQGTLRVAPEKSPSGTFGVAVIRDKKTGKGWRYTIPASLIPQLLKWNKELDPIGRYKAVMDAPAPFEVNEVPAETPERR
jgi:formylmethanofuran dehydrogenase subunit E